MATTGGVTKVVGLRLVDAESESDETESGRCSSSPRVCATVGQRDMTREGGRLLNTGMEDPFQAND